MNDLHYILEITNIEVIYAKAVQALRGLSLRVPEGEIVALLGSNGAGKSTTLKAITNLLALENGEMTAGDIHYDNASIKRFRPHELVRRGLVHVMEGRRIFEELTVEENLVAATYAIPKGKPRPRSFEMVYEYFPRLFERRRGLAGYLSGGEQQMLAIGRSLVSQPRLIVLDEPSLGLAPLLVEEIFEILARINTDQGSAMLLVEQNASVALALASYGYIMETGRIVIDGPASKLMADRDVQEFYLGIGGELKTKSYRDIKHYKRRKRWLS